MNFNSSSLSAKEANMIASLSPITAIAASEKGALDGFGCTCSCGLSIRSSLLTLAQQDAAQHLAWHAKTGK